MNFSKKDVMIGFIIILIIVGATYLYKKNNIPKTEISKIPPPSVEFQEDIEDGFKYNIPDDTTTIELKGDGRGLATSKEILADVENPKIGYFYQGWIENDANLNSLGKLVEGKGGWMLQYPEISDIEGQKIIVSLESVFDNKIEKRILEGSFN